MVLSVHKRRHLRKARDYRCLLNGEDVTLRAFYADARRGVVRLYKTNSDGRFYIDDGGRAAVEERRGKVRLQRNGA